MNTAASTVAVPTDQAFFDEALRCLPTCIAHCRCPDHFHPLWMGLKTAGFLRGVYAQAETLSAILRDHWQPGGHAMIAGAADHGSLDVLSALYGDAGIRFTVVDRCEAPLRLVRARADEKGLAVRTVVGDIADAATDEPWDLVFIHYTLSFMDAPARAQFFRVLRAGLSPRGVGVCAVRFQDPPADDAVADWQGWARATCEQLRGVFGAHPQVLEPMLSWLPDYARARQQRERTMPHPQVLLPEFASAGLKILHATGVMSPHATPAPDLSRRTVTRSQIFLLG